MQQNYTQCIFAILNTYSTYTQVNNLTITNWAKEMANLQICKLKILLEFFFGTSLVLIFTAKNDKLYLCIQAKENYQTR